MAKKGTGGTGGRVGGGGAGKVVQGERNQVIQALDPPSLERAKACLRAGVAKVLDPSEPSRAPEGGSAEKKAVSR